MSYVPSNTDCPGCDLPVAVADGQRFEYGGDCKWWHATCAEQATSELARTWNARLKRDGLSTRMRNVRRGARP